MIANLVWISLACCLLAIVGYMFTILLLIPAWLDEQETIDPTQPFANLKSFLYLVGGPLRLFSLGFTRSFLQPVFYQIMIGLAGVVAILIPYSLFRWVEELLFVNWRSVSNRLWQTNLKADELYHTGSVENKLRIRSFLERMLLRHAPMVFLERVQHLATYDLLELGPDIPTIMAAIACDITRPRDQRLRAIDILRKEGSRSLLLSIAMDLNREERIVTKAVGALENLKDEDASNQAWEYLLNHQEPTVRLGAASKLKSDPEYQGKASASLRILFNDESLPLQTRIEAAAELGQVKKLYNYEVETLHKWMASSSSPERSLQAAFTLASVEKTPGAYDKLRWTFYQNQKDEPLQRLAVQYLGRLGSVNDLVSMGRLPWVHAPTRLYIGEILLENGHGANAVRCWLDLARDTKASLETRLKALQRARQVYQQGRFTQPVRNLLMDALPSLGSEGDPEPKMRLEAARTLIELTETNRARQILLVLSQASGMEPALRRQASRELQRLAARRV